MYVRLGHFASEYARVARTFLSANRLAGEPPAPQEYRSVWTLAQAESKPGNSAPKS